MKSSCEQLIASQTQYLIGALLEFFNQMGASQQSGDSNHQPAQFKARLIEIVGRMIGSVGNNEPNASPAATGASGGVMSSSPFASQLRCLSHQTSLYLANPSTERVLCKPIHRTVGEVLEQLKFFVRTHFPREQTNTSGAASSSSSTATNQQTTEDEETRYLEESIGLLEDLLRRNIVD